MHEDRVTSAVQIRRATGGVAGGTYLFALPGSSVRVPRMRGTKSCNINWYYRQTAPCNFVEILPRLRRTICDGSDRLVPCNPA